MNLILLTPSDLSSDSRAILQDHRADHIRSILKSQPGDTVNIGLINGATAQAIVSSVIDSEIILEIDSWHDQKPIEPTVDIIMALPRPQILRRVLRACGMMAVRHLDLIRANRVEKSYFDSPLLKQAAYTDYLVEGMAQGEHTRLPEVAIHNRFKPFWEDSVPSRNYAGATLILAHDESLSRLSSLTIGRHSHCVVAIGPEGGWVPFETEMIRNAGFQMINLGPWNLRVDAALIATLAQIELHAAASDA